MAATTSSWTTPGDAAPLARRPLTADQAEAVAAVFRLLSDPVRLRLLSLVASHPDGEVRQRELTRAFQVRQPTIAYHLRVLGEAGLISRQRGSKSVYYRIVPQAMSGLAALLDMAPREDEL